jgi:hypothetical protein
MADQVADRTAAVSSVIPEARRIIHENFDRHYRKRSRADPCWAT